MKNTPASRKHLAYAVGGLATAAVVVSLAAYADPAPSTPTGTTIENPAVARAAANGGCSYLARPGEPSGTSYVVLVSRTGAMAGAELPNSLMSDIVDSAGGGGAPVGSLTLVLVGGGGEQPHVVLDGGALTDPTAGDARRARLGSTLAGCLTQVLDAAPYQRKDGSDELRALQVAARLALSASDDGATRLAVVSDGEANAGLLDLRTMGYPTSQPAEVVAAIAKDRQLPRLSGLEVAYYGIGQNRDEAERSWLVDLHRRLCSAAGARLCKVLDARVPVTDRKADAPADPPLRAVARAVSGLPGVDARSTYLVDAAVFQPDSTEFAEPAKVRASLAVVRRAVAAGDVHAVEVVGNACDDGSPEAGLRAIAEARAERVADALRSGPGLGDVDITASGRGADVPLAGPSADGTFTPEDCAQNRRVEITLR